MQRVRQSDHSIRIKTVVYEDDKYDGSPENMASKRMFLDAGVVLIQLPYCLKVCVEEIEE